jgi:hypothetical protein
MAGPDAWSGVHGPCYDAAVMRGASICVVAMLAGCSNVLGIDDLHPPTIHGIVRDIATDTVSNVAVVLHRDPDATRIDEATTSARGTFDIPINETLPFDGYFDLDDPRFVRTFSHLVQPVVDHADMDVEIVTLTPPGLGLLASSAGKSQGAHRWVVIAQVFDAGGSAVTGATVQANADGTDLPASQICYANPSTGLPCGTGSTTGDDGKAWLFDVPEMAMLTITATADSHVQTVSFPVEAGPGLLFTPVPPAP